jgi:hypothetical protein
METFTLNASWTGSTPWKQDAGASTENIIYCPAQEADTQIGNGVLVEDNKIQYIKVLITIILSELWALRSSFGLNFFYFSILDDDNTERYRISMTHRWCLYNRASSTLFTDEGVSQVSATGSSETLNSVILSCGLADLLI